MTPPVPSPARAPEDLPALFAQAWNRQDADALAALFAPDADFVNVVGFWWRRREQIRWNHAYGFAHMFPDTAMTLEKVAVRMLGVDTAVVHAAWRMAGQTRPDGGRGDVRRGVFTFVGVRRTTSADAPPPADTSGEEAPASWWEAAAAHNTDRIPGAQTHVVDDDGALTPASYEH